MRKGRRLKVTVSMIFNKQKAELNLYNNKVVT